MWHVKPLPRLVRFLRIPQQDPIPVLCHIPDGLGVLAVSAVAARLTCLVLETFEPRVELWSPRVVRIGRADPEKRNRAQYDHESCDRRVKTRRHADIATGQDLLPSIRHNPFLLKKCWHGHLLSGVEYLAI